ncbi:uncharacterized protein ATNIH1004_008256 [Aspergillus tanneri]|uniref:Uncharacterized protein n=2 Tax=Aspergillus tanneri TaxID=1220188 RepID=A0A5M9MHW3_9EURO|nr:uncharacterized protein ATNIH1004_008256 [Aspergillus tanneri]KAA8644059.1 hypothetical protein ATNIH1004_008256 [Aspergillus tanneri]
MAPIVRRQSHHPTPAVPRPSKGATSAPIPGTKYISLKILLELFAGTVCIFFLGVLFWKLGRFFRRFTQDRVIREGNTTTARYVKNWYGWVPLQQHETNKELWRKCFHWICDWASWSSKADYSWVWWDPGEEKKSRCKSRRLSRFLPKCFEDYEGTPADVIWGPSGHEPASNQNTSAQCSVKITGALPSIETTRVTSRRSYARYRRIQRENTPTIHEESAFLGAENVVSEDIPRGILTASTANKRRGLTDITPTPVSDRRFLSFDQGPHIQNKYPISNLADYEQSLRYCQSLPCLANPGLILTRLRQSSNASCENENISNHEVMPNTIEFLMRSRKYQIWSTRMEMNMCKNIGYNIKVPPGSPRSELLGSFSSQQAFLLELTPALRRAITMSRSSGSSELPLPSIRKPRRRRVMHSQNDGLDEGSWSSGTILSSPSSSCHSTLGMVPLKQFKKSVQHYRPPNLSMPLKKSTQSQLNAEKKPQTKKTPKAPEATRTFCVPQIKVPIKYLSDWEIRLIDGLDRRLGWLSCQLSPGRKAFHFALLANHWLNKKTWIVDDPVSRVPIDVRRQLGDPRFNVPYPMPEWKPKPKYPEVSSKPAHTPRIDSWRKAMNRQRKASGLKDIIKSVELYDGSIEDPPDGRVDPASWILRKPPQGIHMSTKQETTYYEGGAGWQEQLGDWQRIRRGYRIRKGIHEGRVNRNRAKQFALDVAEYPRKAKLQIVPGLLPGRQGWV